MLNLLEISVRPECMLTGSFQFEQANLGSLFYYGTDLP
jgi:hypothetical protein